MHLLPMTSRSASAKSLKLELKNHAVPVHRTQAVFKEETMVQARTSTAVLARNSTAVNDHAAPRLFQLYYLKIIIKVI